MDEMIKKRTKKLIAMLVGAVVFLLGVSCFPIMEVTDGCECGYKRKWFEMPESMWSRHRFFIRIVASGNPSHLHELWDAQWGVWCKLPWQK